MDKKTVVSFGEILWDILPDETVLGGAPFNLAYRINSLGDTGIIISRIGNDDLGKKTIESVKSLNMDISYIQTDIIHPTGTVKVGFDDKNNPDYLIIPDVAYDYIELNDRILDIVSNADCLCFGTLIQRTAQSRDTLRKIIDASGKCLKFLDLNLRKQCFTLEIIEYSLNHTDILKLNEQEALQLSLLLKLPCRNLTEFCKLIVSKYPLTYGVITLAEKGIYAISKRNDIIYEPGYKIKLGDSIGAGDAASAGLIHSLLDGKTLSESCKLANTLGALVASKKSGTAVVTEEEINKIKNDMSNRTPFLI